jgi:hypothetical protein
MKSLRNYTSFECLSYFEFETPFIFFSDKTILNFIFLNKSSNIGPTRFSLNRLLLCNYSSSSFAFYFLLFSSSSLDSFFLLSDSHPMQNPVFIEDEIIFF